MTIEGVLIAESLRPDATVDDLHLLISKITRWRNPEPLPGQQDVWTILEFSSETDLPDDLARRFGGVLSTPGWYIDFSTDSTKYVIFPDKTFTYPRGDSAGRAEAIAHARSVGVPESQCDWGN